MKCISFYTIFLRSGVGIFTLFASLTRLDHISTIWNFDTAISPGEAQKHVFEDYPRICSNPRIGHVCLVHRRSSYIKITDEAIDRLWWIWVEHFFKQILIEIFAWDGCSYWKGNFSHMRIIRLHMRNWQFFLCAIMRTYADYIRLCDYLPIKN